MRKTKKQIEAEIRLNGTYQQQFKRGMMIVSRRVKALNNVKKPQLFEIIDLREGFFDGDLPSYRLRNLTNGIKKSEFCHVIDQKYREVTDLEQAIFFDAKDIKSND